jgi:N-acyl amino acid synthase of PEP-CTERM/exosortase system
LLRHDVTGEFIGTVRLIVPPAGDARFSAPFQRYCDRSEIQDILPERSTAEVSRFAISKSFRHRTAGETYPEESVRSLPSLHDRRFMPTLSLGLIAAVMQMAFARDITHVCAVMAPALLRLLRRLGIEFKAAGTVVDYHGLRQPCYAECASLLDQVRQACPESWRMMMSADAIAGYPVLRPTC